jgi:sodium pump decarboxylase gamma subunit
MTKIKKKLLLIVSLCLVAAGVFGCGSNNANVTYNGYTAADLAESNTGILDELVGMSEDDLAMYLSYVDQMDESTANALKGWADIKDEIGDFVDYGDVEVTESNGTITVEQAASFTKRDITVTFVYDDDMNVEDITIDMVYSLGETMAKAAMNTAMGMGTVFVMLIIISLIISCFTFINKAQKKSENKPAAAAPAPVVAAPAAPQTDDLELVAVIAAAIAAATGSSTDDFVVRSIKRR